MDFLSFIRTKEDRLRYASFLQLALRGHAQALEYDESGAFLKDDASKAMLLAAGDDAIGEKWLRAHEDKNYSLIEVFSERMRDLCVDRYGMNNVLAVRQAVYTRPAAPICAPRLYIRLAEEKDFPLIRATHKSLPDDVILQIIRRGELYMGYFEDRFVGMIGLHSEGSMGLINILPEFRRRGFAFEMAAYLTDIVLRKGQIPYVQILTDNVASLRTAEKLGFTFADGPCWWLFK